MSDLLQFREALRGLPADWWNLNLAARHEWGNFTFEDFVQLALACYSSSEGANAFNAFSAIRQTTQVQLGEVMRWALGQELDTIYVDAIDLAHPHQRDRISSLGNADISQRSKFEMRVEDRGTSIRFRWKRPIFHRARGGWSREDSYLAIGATTHRTLRHQYKDAADWEKKMIDELEDGFEKLRVRVKKISKLHELARHYPGFNGEIFRSFCPDDYKNSF